MPNKRFITFVAAFVVAVWTLVPALQAAPPATASAPATSRATLLLVHINDVHGHTEGTGDRGGYARLATLVDDLRASKSIDGLLLLHAGDEISRGDELTVDTRGAANFAILKYLRFDAMTPGNGDFYDTLGPAIFNGVKNLQARMAECGFPLLTANVRLKATSQPLGKAYIIKDVAGVKVAIFGLCFVRTEMPSAASMLTLDDPIATAKALVPQLHKQADVVIAMTHIGVDEDVKLAKQVGGIDLIIGAHSHTRLPTGKLVKDPDGKDVLICQAHEHLNCAGLVRLAMSRQGDKWQIDARTAQLMDLDQRVKKDPAVTALIARLSHAASQPAAEPAVK